MQGNYFMPTRIIMGKDAIRNNTSALTLGKKALLVTGKSSSKKNGSLGAVEEALLKECINYIIFDEIEENPSLETVEKASQFGKQNQVDFIIGIGGGSPLDAAKAIGVMIKNPELHIDELIGGNLKSIPIIAVATTAGTGSETTQYAILTNHQAKTKINMGHSIFPEVAFLDASYMMDMSADLTIHTAIDALTHLVESYLSTRSNTLLDLVAEQGMREWGACIDSLLSGYFTYGVREKLMLASTLGGVAIANTGTSLPHGMGYALTYFKNVPHGLANGVLYIHYLRTFKDRTKVEKIHHLLGLKSHQELEKILSILCKHRIKVTEEELKSYAETMCANAAKLSNHPEEVGYEEIYNIYKRSLIQ
ncbi:MAG: iron-containing alcohol dehydrogenase family protein [Cellulosilyticaceae bacterium]